MITIPNRWLRMMVQGLKNSETGRFSGLTAYLSGRERMLHMNLDYWRAKQKGRKPYNIFDVLGFNS